MGGLFEEHMFVSRRMRWVEDAVPTQFSDSERMSSFIGTSVGHARIILFGVLGATFLFALFLRVMQLQLIENDEWRTVAEHNRLRMQPIIPERGIIFDRNMVPLVTNVPNFRLTLRAQDLPRDPVVREQHIREIGATVGVPGEKIEQVLTAFQKYRYASVVIKEPVSYEEAVAVYLKSSAYPSLTIERGAKRRYVAGVPGLQTELPSSTAHVLGYLGRISPDELESLREHNVYYPTDMVGKTGVEAVLEAWLRGSPGERGAEVDARGAERRTVSVKQPLPGSSVVLTIDLEIQRHLESALRTGLRLANQKRGSAVALDPRTGAILGIVSMPAYDSNVFSDAISSKEYAALLGDPDQPMVNRAISGQFPSGSTIKPFYAAAALQEGVITPETTVLSTGGLQLGGWFFGDWKAGGHGVTNVRKAIAESVNTFFYTIGAGYGDRQGLGPERMKQYLEYFGFGRPTGLAVPGEASGFLPSPAWKKEKKGEQWYTGDSFNMSIGQGDVLVTPLQVATALASIANNGTLWKPYVVSYRTNLDGTEIVTQPQMAAKVPIKPEWLQVVREGMRMTVTAGSARSLNALPIEIAGKTGTAQWHPTKGNHAWFESFAPYQNPEIVTVFLIEEGKEGSSVAVPAAREFYSWWATYR